MIDRGTASYAGIVGLEVGTDWLLGPGLRDFLPPGDDALIPFILQTEDEGALRVLNTLLRAPRPAVVLGDGSETTPEVKPGQYVTAYARKEFFDALAGDENLARLRDAPKRILLGLPLSVTSIAVGARLLSPPAPPPIAARCWPPGTVVIGVIDDGIAVGHERFRRADGSARVESFWNQDALSPPNSSVAYGQEFGRAELDQLLQECRVGAWVHEDRLYRRIGVADFAQPNHKSVAWRQAHGTHVLDLAAGYAPAEDRADRPIIAVQLRVAATADQSGAGLESYVLDAIKHIVGRARLLTLPDEPPLPVVINFSYGTHAGPHDGTSPMEAAIDQAIAQANAPVRVVLPSGNSHQSRCHAQVDLASTGTVAELRMRVQPDDQTPSTVQFWLPPRPNGGPPGSRVSLEVEAPDGTSTGWIDEGAAQSLPLPGNGPPYCLAEHGVQDGRGVFRIDLHPTVRLHPVLPASSATAPAGLWTIRLRNDALAPGSTVQAWIERDSTLYGYPRRGRQTYFDEPTYRRWDAQGRPVEDDGAAPGPVRRDGMVNAIATGRLAPVIGGFVRQTQRLAPYSAGGPIVPPPGAASLPGRKPDALAVCDDSKVHAGVLAAGSRSGSVVAMNGTSVAAPQVTRWVADQLATGAPSDRAAIQQLAQAQESAMVPPGPALPPNRGGWGRIQPQPMQGARRRFVP